MVVVRVQVSVSTNGKELCSERGAIIHLGLIARRFDPSVLPSAFSGRDHAAVRGTNTERARNRPLCVPEPDFFQIRWLLR